jgi:hypothetical protein
MNTRRTTIAQSLPLVRHPSAQSAVRWLSQKISGNGSTRAGAKRFWGRARRRGGDEDASPTNGRQTNDRHSSAVPEDGCQLHHWQPDGRRSNGCDGDGCRRDDWHAKHHQMQA